MSMNAEFRAILEDGDVDRAMLAWKKIAPHLPQPQNRAQAEALLHRARTEAQSIPFSKRAYSHRWLTERGIPSSLPDNLRPRAERMYPKIVTAVGIACASRSGLFKPVAREIQKAMERAVLECYADGDTDPVLVKAHMMRARQNTAQKLLGRLGLKP